MPCQALWWYSRSVPKKPTRQKVCSNLVRLLKEERIRQELSLNALAKKAGISQQMVSYVEREQRVPTIDTLLRICDALGVRLWELLRDASEG